MREALESAAASPLFAPLAPLAALAFALALALASYGARNRRRGKFRDEEMDERGQGGLTSAGLRHFFAWLMRPLWQSLARAEVPPNAITTLSVGLSIGSGIAAAAGRFALGGWLFLAAGALDFLDGRLARETGRAGPAGAALDSVLDRYAEAALLVGLAWYYRESPAALALALFALTGSLFVPYVRARGESLGATMNNVGFMQRPERVALLGITVALAPALDALLGLTAAPAPFYLVWAGLFILALGSHVTALIRLCHLMRDLSPPRPAPRESRVVRATITSVLATACDIAAVFALVELAGQNPAIATGLGCVVGGVVAFTVSRSWAFEAEHGPRTTQLIRFVFVSGTSAGLNAGGVALLLLWPEVYYPIAWAIARGVVFLTWNYPLLRDWVFPPEPIRASAGAAAPIESELDAPRVPRST